jgi:hypothetical protein
MWTRTTVLARIALIVLGSAATAESASRVGTLTAVNEGSVQVMTTRERERSFLTTRRTKYVKWINVRTDDDRPDGGKRRQPRGASLAASGVLSRPIAFLTAGRRFLTRS